MAAEITGERCCLRRQMDANCLGWDCSIAGQAGYRGKYGIGGPGSAGLQTFFGILAGTIAEGPARTGVIVRGGDIIISL